MTLKQMATAVRNHVVDGLKGISNISFSIEQLEDEILLSTQSVMLEYAAKGLIKPEKFAQRIDGIRIDCRDLSNNCEVVTDSCAPHFEIPAVNLLYDNPITYLGTINGEVAFKIYLDKTYRYHKYRVATSKKPFAWVSTTPNNKGLFDVYLFNMGKYSELRYVSIDALFDNPTSLVDTPYYEQFSHSDFFAPFVVQDAVITKMTEKYIKYYRQFEKNLKTNVQE
ncbi:MAG: hypothetical protein KAH32_03785 [Chlamydiia bacterium]|nr:hypothetical protein [Chlamydiia bacterium]